MAVMDGGSGYAGAYQNQYQTSDSSVAGQIWNFFTNNGLSPNATAGIMGNLAQESSLNPNESGGYLAQWGGDRLTNLQAYANSKNEPVTDLNTQLGFIMKELPSYVDVNKLNSMSPSDAALAVSQNYEKPAFWAANNTRRENLANSYYQEYMNGASPTGTPQGTNDGSNGGNGSASNSSNKFTGVSGMWESLSKWENPQGGVAGFISGGVTTDATAYLHRLPFIILGIGIIILAVASMAMKKSPSFIPSMNGTGGASSAGDTPVDQPTNSMAPPVSSGGAGKVVSRGGGSPATVIAENPELLALA